MPTRTNKRTGEVQELQNGQWVTVTPPSKAAPVFSVPTKPADPARPAVVRKTNNEAVASDVAPAQAAADLRKTRAQTEATREQTRLERDRLNTYLAVQGLMISPDGQIVARPGGPVVKSNEMTVKQKQQAEALLRAAGVDLAKGVDPIAPLITGSTSGRVQHLGAEAYGAVTGDATSGMENIGKLAPIVSDMVLSLTGGGLGNQVSDADRKFIIDRVGNLADPNIPANQRLAAWNSVKQRMANILGVQQPQMSEDQVVSELQARVRRGDSPADTVDWLVGIGRPPNKETVSQIIAGTGNPDTIAEPPRGFERSILGQGLAGANEGLGQVLGAPADLATAAINAGTGGLNALAGTDIPRIERPFLGSEQINDFQRKVGSIYEPVADNTKQFARRVGQSVGAAAVPVLGPEMTLGRYGAQLLTGLSGGFGGAAAQKLFPGNPVAEILGEILGGAGSARGVTSAARRAGERKIAAAVPTVDQLKQQTGNLYRAAESRGVVADATKTKKLNDDIRQALTDEGRLSPTGRITEAYPKAKEATQLIGDYAGKTMTPTQIQSVRKVISDGLSSSEPAERRLSGILTDVFDNFANPLAPELRDARGLASRYITAGQLERARELAGARASQFTGSGFENALRTEYRNLDRGSIKGTKHFSADVNDAIERVARGTPASNALRGLGKLAPTGVVSGMGSVLPALSVGAMTDPATGGMLGAGLAGLGIIGRSGATHMGIKAADRAELIARNGGKLPMFPPSPEMEELMRRLALSETAKYLPQ